MGLHLPPKDEQSFSTRGVSRPKEENKCSFLHGITILASWEIWISGNIKIFKNQRPNFLVGRQSF
jgi:hypothetical protein